MVNEYLMIVVMAVCGSLFALGGTGFKAVRRFGIPLFLAIVAVCLGVIWWRVLGMTISLIVALSMGYGEGSNWLKKVLTFSLYGASFLWLGWSLWIILTPSICILLFALSNWKPTAKTFFWKCCEFLFGTFIGITFISVV